MSKTFFYFAFGSNLLGQRIHINNPTAVRKCPGKLKDYRLGFGHWAERWKGHVATIIPDTGKHLWGAIWEINCENLLDLDRQEGVHQGIYFSLDVKVEGQDGEIYTCRTYQLCETIDESMKNLDDSECKRPSYVYRDVMIRGARETGLPEEYINYLENIPHNGYTGEVQVNLNL